MGKKGWAGRESRRRIRRVDGKKRNLTTRDYCLTHLGERDRLCPYYKGLD